jgi:hypothetical protein
MKSDQWRATRTVLILLLILFLVGLAVAVYFDQRSSGDDLQRAHSRAGVGVALTTVAGALVTVVLKARDERRLRDQERRDFFHEVVNVYNAVKAVRRQLRTTLSRPDVEDTPPGLRARMVRRGTGRRRRSRSCSGGAGAVNKQIDAMGPLMQELNVAQLRFEALKRESTESALFRDQAVADCLQRVESYLHDRIVKPWENGTCWTKADWQQNDLRAFVAPQRRRRSVQEDGVRSNERIDALTSQTPIWPR